MTALVLLGACAVILAAASIFIVGVAVGFGIARRRYQSPRRHVAFVAAFDGRELDRVSVPVGRR